MKATIRGEGSTLSSAKQGDGSGVLHGRDSMDSFDDLQSEEDQRRQRDSETSENKIRNTTSVQILSDTKRGEAGPADCILET